MAYRESFHIAAPVPSVFAFFRDPRNFTAVAPAEIAFSDFVLTERGVGTSYQWETTIAGVRLRGSDVYTEFVPDQRITDRSSSALEGTWTYTFEPDGSGTRLSVENCSRSVWNLPPLRQLLDLVAARTHRPRFQQMKATLEQ